jgi:hypothetical protein
MDCCERGEKMLGKVYFSDGTTEPITHYIVHGKYDVEFNTEDAHYHYIALIEDVPEVYVKNSLNVCCKYLTHHFYRIVYREDGRQVIPANIDKIEIIYGKGEGT